MERIGKKVRQDGIDENYTVRTGIGDVYKDDIWRQYGREWWAFAEAIIGYYNLYEITGDYSNYEICKKIWATANEHIVDKKYGGWIGYYYYPELLDRIKEYDKRREKIENETICKISPWHCCYHNSRMCFEIIDRLKNKSWQIY